MKVSLKIENSYLYFEKVIHILLPNCPKRGCELLTSIPFSKGFPIINYTNLGATTNFVPLFHCVCVFMCLSVHVKPSNLQTFLK